MRPRRAELGALGASRAERVGALRVARLGARASRRPLSAMTVTMGPGAEHAALRHQRTWEFFLVLRGSVRARLGAGSRRLRRGDFAFLPPGCAHSFRAGPSGVTVLAVFAPPLDPRRPDIVYEA